MAGISKYYRTKLLKKVFIKNVHLYFDLLFELICLQKSGAEVCKFFGFYGFATSDLYEMAFNIGSTCIDPLNISFYFHAES